jgi:hypothetical protein
MLRFVLLVRRVARTAGCRVPPTEPATLARGRWSAFITGIELGPARTLMPDRHLLGSADRYASLGDALGGTICDPPA